MNKINSNSPLTNENYSLILDYFAQKFKGVKIENLKYEVNDFDVSKLTDYNNIIKYEWKYVNINGVEIDYRVINKGMGDILEFKILN